MTRSIRCRDLLNFLEFEKKKLNFFEILLKARTKIFTPFCRSRRADSKKNEKLLIYDLA